MKAWAAFVGLFILATLSIRVVMGHPVQEYEVLLAIGWLLVALYFQGEER